VVNTRLTEFILDVIMGNNRRQMLFALLLFQMIAFCLFANTFANSWTYDDFPIIVENTDIRSIQSFLQDTYPGRPLREITYLLDYALFGLNPAGYHIQNIFWHAVNVFLIWLLVLDLGASRCVAWISALIFLAHPLNVEVVANISHRKDSLVLAFCLLSLLCFIRFRRESDNNRQWLLGAAAFWGIALSAKQNAAMMPILFIAYEMLYGQPGKKHLLDSKVLIIVLCGSFTLLGWYVYTYQLANFNEELMKAVLVTKTGFSGNFSFSIYYATIFKCWFFSWSRMFVPLLLAPEYTFSAAVTWFDIDVMLAVITVTAVITTIVLLRKKNPLISFCLIWFLVFWLPVANLLPQVYLAADRYLYVPLVGMIIVFSTLTSQIVTKRNLFGSAAAVCVLLSLSVLTWRQNTVWRSPETLWSQAVKVSPESSFALNNLGNVYLLKGQILEAKKLYEKTTRVDPSNATAWYNLGMIYEKAGLTEEALQHYRKFLATRPAFFDAQAAELKKRFPGIL
jgi:4-amino-4-deoxy-L-arabinose transferase-like glycosyltransferase